MFRLLPINKSGFFWESLSSSSDFYLLRSHSANCIHNLSNGTHRGNKELDYELLFDVCTTSDIAKHVHALLIVSGKILKKDAYSWNSMVSAFVRNRHFSDAVKYAFEMLSTPDVRPDFYTFPAVLKACSALIDGSRLHCWIIKMGCQWDVFVSASLVHMYCRFDFPSSAYNIFKTCHPVMWDVGTP